MIRNYFLLKLKVIIILISFGNSMEIFPQDIVFEKNKSFYIGKEIKDKEFEQSLQKIQDNIFRYNYEIMHKNFENEIKSLDKNTQINFENRTALLHNGINYNIGKYKLIIENIIKNSHSDIIIAESYYRLSLINIEENPKNFIKSIDLINNGLKYIDEKTDAHELYIKMNLYSGGLYLLNENYDLSAKYYQKVQNFIVNAENDNLYVEEKIRSLLGEGDCDYLQLNFEAAFKKYKLAESILQGEINLTQDTKQRMDALVSMRIILAAYRNGDYSSSLDHIKKYAYKRESLKRYIDSNLVEGIEKIGGISLFEIKNERIYEEVAKDKVYGDFGKEIILQSFPLFSKSGDTKFIEKIAKNIKSDFYNSIKYISFLQAWIDINYNNENKEEYFDSCYYGTTEISKNSLWRGRFVLDKKEDDERKNIILKYAFSTAEYYYNKGIQNKSNKYFLRTSEIYNSRIQENLSFDNKGLLFQKYADSLYMSQDYYTARDAIERGLKYNLEDRDLKSGLFLQIRITRQLSSDSKKTSEKSYKTYESAVDSFFARFPEEKQARDSLHESAKRAEILEDFENAKLRYERLMSYVPQQEDETILQEKNKYAQALAYILPKITNKKSESGKVASELESYSNQFELNEVTKKLIKSTNSQIAKSYYTQLNHEGKIRESANYLSLWAENNNKNPNSSAFYIDSIKIFAQLQEWKEVLTLCKNFIKIYPEDDKLLESLFWQGKANENLLLFDEASINYEKSVNLSDKNLMVKDKMFALNRAIDIYTSLNKNMDAARVLKTKSRLQINQHFNANEIASTKILTSEIYFKLNEIEKSKNIYKSIVELKNLDKKIRSESNINFLVASKKHNDKSIEKIDYALKNYVNGKIKLNKDFIEKTINFLNSKDKNLFLALNTQIHSDFKNSLLDKMEKITQRLENRALYISHISPILLARTNSSLGKMKEVLSDTYSYSYYYNNKKNDNYLKNANNSISAAKKFYSMALASRQLNDLNKMEMHLESSNFFQIPKNIPFELFFNTDIKSEKSRKIYSTDLL